MSIPWSAHAVLSRLLGPRREATNRPTIRDHPYGLDLYDCPLRLVGRVVAATGAVIPPPPLLPPNPPGPYPFWLPSWLELPLPRRQPSD